MSKVAVTYSPLLGGYSVISLKESFKEVGAEVIDADFRQMMEDIPDSEFTKLYATPNGRQQLFAHAKLKAFEILKDVDCLALSGNNAMIDPELFHKKRQAGEYYDFSRTIAELALTHVATEKGIPILGSCGGHQVIAVLNGGEIADLSIEDLEKQSYMDYETIKINKDSLLAKIIGGEALDQDPTLNHYEYPFFGAHAQTVSKLPKGFKQSAISCDGHSNEATESEFGAPVLTTQFHAEVGAKGLPNAEFMYKGTEEQIKTNLKVFEYFNKAGDAYRQKKSVIDELKSFKPADEQQSIKPSDVKAQRKPKQAAASAPKKENTFNLEKALGLTVVIGACITAAAFVAFPPLAIIAATGVIGSAVIGAVTGALAACIGFGIGAGLAALATAIKDGIGSFLRNRAASLMTKVVSAALREKNAPAPEELTATNSYTNLLTRICSPGELLRDTPMQAWKKQDEQNPVHHSVIISNKAGKTSNFDESESPTEQRDIRP